MFYIPSQVASTLRLACDKKTQSQFRYLWRSNESLRNEVKDQLMKKRNVDEKAEDKHVSIVSKKNDAPTACNIRTHTNLAINHGEIQPDFIIDVKSDENVTINRPCEVQSDVSVKQMTAESEQYYCDNVITDFTSKYNVIKIVGDGNCLFRCFSYCLYGDQKFHSDVRKEIVDYVVDNWTAEVDMLRSTCEYNIYNDEMEYERIMGSEGTYGTDFELGIFAKLYGFPVAVYRKIEGDRIIRVMNSVPNREVEKRICSFMFSGAQRSGHWEVVEEIPAKSQLPAEKHDTTRNETNNNEADYRSDNSMGAPSFKNRIDCKKNLFSATFRNKQIKSSDEQIKNGGEKDPFEFVTDSDSPTKTDKEAVELPSYRDGKFSEKTHEAEVGYDSMKKGVSNEETNKRVSTVHNTKYCKRRLLYKTPTKKKIETGDENIKNGGRKDTSGYVADSDSPTKTDESDIELLSDNGGKYSDITYQTEADSDVIKIAASNERPCERKRKKIFTKHLAEVVIPSTWFKTVYGYTDKAKIRAVIERAMLQIVRCTCTLSFWGSIRYNSHNIVAYARCIKADHEQRFHFRMDKVEEPLARLIISSNKGLKYVHQRSPKKFRGMREQRRAEFAEDLKHRRPANVMTELQKNTSIEIMNDGHMQDLCTIESLYKIKSEEKCKRRLSLKSLDLSDLTQLWIEDQKEKDPFLQYVILPLAAIMYTKQDLDVVHEGKPTILHMDATGSIARKPEDLECKRIFYYCILMKHDIELLTLAHMITSEHDITCISIFLKTYRSFVIKCGRKWPFASAITIDWSWAFIHAILQEWNSVTIQEYLNIMYKYCVDDVAPKKNLIIVKTCFGHFMKRISRAIHREFQKHIAIKAFILECMGLLCLCRNMKQLDEIFKHFATILLAKSEEKANDSIIAISSMIKKNIRNDNKLSEDINEIIKDAEDVEDFQCEYTAIYRNSQFFNRYDEMVVLLCRKLEGKESCITNKYYAPEFLKYAVRKYMSYTPLWSALDLDLVDPSISRISNAFVESANRVMKEIVFEGTTNASIADRVRQLKTARMDTMAKIKLDVRLKGTQKSCPKPKYPETASNPFVQENWMRHTQHRKRKIGHLGASKLQDRSEEIIKKKKTIDERRINHEERRKNIKPNKRKERIVNKPTKTVFQGSVLEKATKCASDIDTAAIENHAINEHVSQEEIVRVDCINEMLDEEYRANKKLSKFYNGLIKDKNYYMASKSSSITVGMYNSDAVLAFNKFQLTTKEYASLRDRMWINGVAIDCFVASKLHEWPDCSYISTDNTAFILGDYSGKRISTQRKIFQINDGIKNNLLMPYLYEGHWRLLVATISEKKLTFIDPYEVATDVDRAVKSFRNFISCCGDKSAFRTLRNINWEVDFGLSQRPFQHVNDGHNCGVYVMHYMECLGLGKSFDMNFNPSQYRSEVAYELLLKSDNMEDTCLHCFQSVTSNSVQCEVCNRKCHEQCIYKTNAITDDEEEVIEKKIKRKKILCATKPQKLLCRLCKIYVKRIS